MNKPFEKRYIGDAVYVEYNGHSFVLTTENGITTTNIIFLEPEVYTELLKYGLKVKHNNMSAEEISGRGNDDIDP